MTAQKVPLYLYVHKSICSADFESGDYDLLKFTYVRWSKSLVLSPEKVLMEVYIPPQAGAVEEAPRWSAHNICYALLLWK